MQARHSNLLESLDAKVSPSAAINIRSSCGQAAELAELDSLPVFELRQHLEGESSQELAISMAECLRDTGCLIVRDSRVDAHDNETFLNLMERYFEQPENIKLRDARPELHYQVGVTPEGIEVPRCTMDPSCLDTVAQQPPEHRATLPSGPDPKWRFFWRVGERPAQTDFAELNAEPVIPAGFPEWAAVLDGWGSKMLAALHTTAQLVAIGLGLPANALTSLMHQGPHLLGPTGINLGQCRAAGASFAGFHYDLNLLTIHGKARFPGLHIWLADGRRVPVRVPEGCLLLQAGKQLEWLTAGAVKAGMHEVVYSEAVAKAVASAKAQGRSMWRVSSTVFGHVASDQVLQPLGAFSLLKAAQEYPPIKAGAYVEQELSVIALKG